MPDETVATGTTSISTDSPGTTVTTESAPKNISEYVLYKLDRSAAILGIVAIAIAAIWRYSGNEGMQIAMVAVGGLATYIGGRTGK